MKMKKMIAALLAAGMTLALSACGGSGTGDSSSAAQSGGNDDGELYNVVMEIVTVGENPSGIEDVENAINAIVEDEIGVTVTLYPVSVADLSTQTNLMLTSGEKLDLICVSFGSTVADYVNKGMIIELDDLYEKYGADIKKSQGIAMAGGYYGGKLYSIPIAENMGTKVGYMARTDLLEELGFEVEEGKIYSIEDLTELFRRYKEKYGEGYYCVAGMSATSDFYNFYNQIDFLGGSSSGAVGSTGVLMGAGLDGNTTVENLYASEEYAAHAKLAYEWAQAGYIPSNAATNTDSAQMQIMNGHYLGSFGYLMGDSPAVFSQGCNYDITVIQLAENYATTSDFNGITWAIPNTCENPDKAFQFLNLLYQDRELDKDIDTMLTLGLENVSYKMVDKGEGSRGIITWADGVDSTSTPYNMALGVYGDKVSQPKWEPLTLDYYEDVEKFNTSITEENKSCTLGYVFNASKVATQKAAVDSVVTQYMGLIAGGSVNPDEVLPEFNQALKDAGIDEVIAENQKQLDEWLAQQ